MFFPDRQKALAGIRRALKPGARFVAVVWAPRDKNPSQGIPVRAVESRLGPQPRATMVIAGSMGEPGLLEETLTTAGFRDVAVHAVPANRPAGSLEAMLENMRNRPA